jgi:hypothetical protein
MFLKKSAIVASSQQIKKLSNLLFFRYLSLNKVIDVDKPSSAASFRSMTLRVMPITRTLKNATLSIIRHDHDTRHNGIHLNNTLKNYSTLSITALVTVMLSVVY